MMPAGSDRLASATFFVLNFFIFLTISYGAELGQISQLRSRGNLILPFVIPARKYFASQPATAPGVSTPDFAKTGSSSSSSLQTLSKLLQQRQNLPRSKFSLSLNPELNVYDQGVPTPTVAAEDVGLPSPPSHTDENDQDYYNDYGNDKSHANENSDVFSKLVEMSLLSKGGPSNEQLLPPVTPAPPVVPHFGDDNAAQLGQRQSNRYLTNAGNRKSVEITIKTGSNHDEKSDEQTFANPSSLDTDSAATPSDTDGTNSNWQQANDASSSSTNEEPYLDGLNTGDDNSALINTNGKPDSAPHWLRPLLDKVQKPKKEESIQKNSVPSNLLVPDNSNGKPNREQQAGDDHRPRQRYQQQTASVNIEEQQLPSSTEAENIVILKDFDNENVQSSVLPAQEEEQDQAKADEKSRGHNDYRNDNYNQHENQDESAPQPRTKLRALSSFQPDRTGGEGNGNAANDQAQLLHQVVSDYMDDEQQQKRPSTGVGADGFVQQDVVSFNGEPVQQRKVANQVTRSRYPAVTGNEQVQVVNLTPANLDSWPDDENPILISSTLPPIETNTTDQPTSGTAATTVGRSSPNTRKPPTTTTTERSTTTSSTTKLPRQQSTTGSSADFVGFAPEILETASANEPDTVEVSSTINQEHFMAALPVPPTTSTLPPEEVVTEPATTSTPQIVEIASVNEPYETFTIRRKHFMGPLPVPPATSALPPVEVVVERVTTSTLATVEHASVSEASTIRQKPFTTPLPNPPTTSTLPPKEVSTEHEPTLTPEIVETAGVNEPDGAAEKSTTQQNQTVTTSVTIPPTTSTLPPQEVTTPHKSTMTPEKTVMLANFFHGVAHEELSPLGVSSTTPDTRVDSQIGNPTNLAGDLMSVLDHFSSKIDQSERQNSAANATGTAANAERLTSRLSSAKNAYENDEIAELFGLNNVSPALSARAIQS